MISASCGDWSVTTIARHGVNTGGAIRSRTGLTGFAIRFRSGLDQHVTRLSSPQLPTKTPLQVIDLHELPHGVAEMISSHFHYHSGSIMKRAINHFRALWGKITGQTGRDRIARRLAQLRG